jgi:hypothetical protein
MIRIHGLTVATATVALLAGCSATSINFDAMTAEDLKKQPQYMEIRPSVPDGVVVVGDVSAEICNKRRSEAAPTDDTILTLLKLRAAEAGGTRLANVSFKVTPEGTDTCFAYASAKGTAYIHNDDPD